jgi:hypothetical protein
MQKPIDLGLCLLGIAAGIIMWLIPKTPVSIDALKHLKKHVEKLSDEKKKPIKKEQS